MRRWNVPKPIAAQLFGFVIGLAKPDIRRKPRTRTPSISTEIPVFPKEGEKKLTWFTFGVAKRSVVGIRVFY